MSIGISPQKYSRNLTKKRTLHECPSFLSCVCPDIQKNTFRITRSCYFRFYPTNRSRKVSLGSLEILLPWKFLSNLYIEDLHRRGYCESSVKGSIIHFWYFFIYFIFTFCQSKLCTCIWAYNVCTYIVCIFLIAWKIEYPWFEIWIENWWFISSNRIVLTQFT